MAEKPSQEKPKDKTSVGSLNPADYLAQLSHEPTALHHDVSGLPSQKEDKKQKLTGASQSDILLVVHDETIASAKSTTPAEQNKPPVHKLIGGSQSDVLLVANDGAETIDSAKPGGTILDETIAAGLPTIDMKDGGENGSLKTLATTSRFVDTTAYIGLIGDYQLIEQIGRGGMGVVYKAHQKKVGRIVALKVIAAGSLCAPEDIARFHDEASAAGRLSHPGIVAVYDAGEHEGTHYFSMAYIEGDSLASFVGRDKPRLDPRRAAKLMADVCRAVQYAHDRAVIHRDIKPANIMLDKSGQPLLTDFGLAKLVGNEGLTMTGQVMGTPNYMAPEQAKGQQDAISNRTDVYSLGATLYALLNGAPAFVGRNLMETLRKVESAAPEPLTFKGSPVPLDLWIICEKSLAKRPEDRYESAAALADDIDRYLQGFPISARAVGPVTRFQRWCQRNPVIAALIGTVAATLVLATVVSIALAVKARAEQSRAEANLGFVEDVLQEALISVSEDDLSNEPGTQKVRQRLLTIAQDYYEQLNMTQQISSEKVADAAFMLGRVEASLGMDAKAQKSLDEALRIQNELLPTAEDQVEALVDIAATHKELSRLGEKLWNSRGLSDPDDAAKKALLAGIKHNEQCVEYRDRAAELEPDDAELQRLLASGKMGLGLALIQLGRWETQGDALARAEKSLTEAEDLRKKTIKKTPDDPQLLQDAARGSAAIADLREAQANLFAESDPEKSKQLLEESLGLRTEAAQKFASLPAEVVNPETRSQLATCYQLCAESNYQLGKTEDSIADYQRTLGVLRQLLMSNPLVTRYRVNVAQIQFMLSQLYFAKGDDLGFQLAYEFQQTLVDGLAIDPHNQALVDLLLEYTTSLSESFIGQELFPEALNQIEQAKNMLTDIQILDADKPLIDAVVEKLELKAEVLRKQINAGDRTT